MAIKNNVDHPASPLLLDTKPSHSGGSVADDWFEGLTKREMFCLHMGVAETGDAELDAIVCKGNRQKMAMHFMAHLMPNERIASYEEQASLALKASDALLVELERTK